MRSKKIGVLAFSLVLLGATAAQADAPHVLSFGDWGGRGLGKLRSKNVADRQLLPECTAFLTGPRQITTAAHCGEFGTENLEFVLHYKDGSGAANLRLTKVFTTGGGFGKNEERRGWDWMHILLAEDAPETGALNSKVKPFELSNDAAETDTGAKAFVVSYRSDVQKGEVPTWQQCKVEDPQVHVKTAEEYCDVVGKDKEGKKIYACNFFTLDCPPAKDGLDSGSPVFGETGKVIGILAARSTIDGKLVAWVVTANESRKAASNPFFHWLNLLRYAEIDQLVEAKRFLVADIDAKDKGLDKYIALLAEWPELSVEKRFQRLQQWDTVGGQEIVGELNRSMAKQLKDGNKAFALALGKAQTLTAREKHAFGQHYNDGLPVAHDTMLTSRQTALTEQIARVALLEKVKKESEALAKAERERDKKNFETLVTNTQKRAKKVLTDWINLAGEDAIGIEFYRKQVGEITRVDANADSYTKDKLKQQVAWLEKRNDWMKEVESEQESFALRRKVQRNYEQALAERRAADRERVTPPAMAYPLPPPGPGLSPLPSSGLRPDLAVRPSSAPTNRVVQPTDSEWIEARRRVEENYRRATAEAATRAAPSYYTPPSSYAPTAPTYRPAMSPPLPSPSRVVQPTDREWIDARNAVLENLRRAQQGK